jgi:hypothetical protein
MFVERLRYSARRMHVIAHRKPLPGAAWGIGLALALLALFMAGCGTTIISSGPTPGSTPGSTPAATTTRNPGPIGGLPRPCPGPNGSALGAGGGVVILTPSTPNHSATAQIGETVEVRLPNRTRWMYNAAASAPAGLSLIQPAGIEDTQLGLCIWSFSVRSAGTATLAFTGLPHCDPTLACPQIAQVARFTVKVG